MSHYDPRHRVAASWPRASHFSAEQINAAQAEMVRVIESAGTCPMSAHSDPFKPVPIPESGVRLFGFAIELSLFLMPSEVSLSLSMRPFIWKLAFEVSRFDGYSAVHVRVGPFHLWYSRCWRGGA